MTVPTIEACANAVAGISATDVSTITRSSRCISILRGPRNSATPLFGFVGLCSCPPVCAQSLSDRETALNLLKL